MDFTVKQRCHLIIALTLILALVCCACGAPATTPVSTPTNTPPEASATPPQGPQSVMPILTDMSGNQIELKQTPQRVVSLSPSTTEILFALGVEARIVAIDEQSSYPEQTTQIDKVTDPESIVAKEPEVVFVDRDYSQTDADALKGEGIAVVYSEAGTYGELYTSIALVAQVMQADATDLVASMQTSVQEALDEVALINPLSVYYVAGVGEDGHKTAASDTFIGEVLELGGGINVITDPNQTTVDVAQLAALEPDVLLVSSECSLEEVCKMEAYRDLRAVKEGRTYSVDASLISRPGPRIAKAIEHVGEIIKQAGIS